MTEYESISIPESDKELWEKFKSLRWREKKTVSELIRDAVKEYYQVHADANPNYTMDHFQHDVMMATPAFFRPYDVWKKWYSTIKSMKEYKKIDDQINILWILHNKEWQRCKDL